MNEAFKNDFGSLKKLSADILFAFIAGIQWNGGRYQSTLIGFMAFGLFVCLGRVNRILKAK